MPIDSEGRWELDISPKQRELMRLCREKNGLRKYILAAGARWSSKSIGALHAVVDHAWNTKNAAVSLLCTTITAGADQGIWTLLTEVIIPMWIEGDFGLEWAEKGTPRQHGVTKKFYCIIKNKWGGNSRMQLDSLKDERDVEASFKNRYLTMIYWSEVSIFKQVKTYQTLIQALRGLGTPQDEFVLLCDTNPSEEGTDSWIYKEWYEFRLADPLTLSEDERPRQAYLKLLEFLPDDNPYLTEDFKRQKRAEFAADPDLFARYWLGQWKKSSVDALFIGQFKRAIHVIETNDEGMCVPQDDCEEACIGWDIGRANHGVEFAEKCYGKVEGTNSTETSVFKFFDEVVIIGGETSVWDLTVLVVERMLIWEAYLGRKVNWSHHSDRSSLDQREPISNRFPADEVYAASEGTIVLVGVENTRNSVGPSIRLWRKMLFQRRLLFSGELCPKLVEVQTSLRRGKLPDTIHDQSPHKHPFDAGRYIIMRECWDELQTLIVRRAQMQRPPQRLVSVPL